MADEQKKEDSLSNTKIILKKQDARKRPALSPEEKLGRYEHAQLLHDIRQKRFTDKYYYYPVNRMLITEIRELKKEYPTMGTITSFINEALIQHLKRFRTQKLKDEKEGRI